MLARATLLLALLAAAPAPALDLELEAGPLVLFPIGPFLDGQAATLTGFDLGQLGLGGGVQDVTALTDVTHSTGGGISLALLIGQWEIRYELGVLPYDQVVLTHLGVNAGDLSIYLDANELLGQSVKDNVSKLDSALFHSFGFGYRFEPFPEWVFSPYVPFGLGFAVAQPRNDVDAMIGANVQIGIGGHARLGSMFDLGVALRYGISVFKNADTSLSALSRGATASVTTGSSAFDAAVEVLQTVSLSFTLGLAL